MKLTKDQIATATGLFQRMNAQQLDVDPAVFTMFGFLLGAVKTVENLKLTMTALQWMTRFDHVQPKRMGRSNDMCWMHAFAWKVGEPGETPHYFLMEHVSGEVRVIKNLSSEECTLAMMDPPSFWDHPTANKLS